MKTFITPKATKTIKVTHKGHEGTMTIGPIDTYLRAYIDDTFETEKDGSFKRKHARLVEIFRFGVRGWDIKDFDGSAIEYKTEEADVEYIGKRNKVSDEAMVNVDFYTVIEVAIKVINENYLGAEEKKA